MSASGFGFTSNGGRVRGVCTTVEHCANLHDFFREIKAPDETSEPLAKYALCVAMRFLARPSKSAIFAFVMTEANVSAAFTLNTLMSCISLVQSNGPNVMCVLMDGSSVNIRVFKQLLGAYFCLMHLRQRNRAAADTGSLPAGGEIGMADGQIGLDFAHDATDCHRFKTSFTNPDNPDRKIYLTVCR